MVTLDQVGVTAISSHYAEQQPSGSESRPMEVVVKEQITTSWCYTQDRKNET